MLTDYTQKRPAGDANEALKLAVAMREAQRRYFQNRTRENLIASKDAEKAFDRAAGAQAQDDEPGEQP